MAYSKIASSSPLTTTTTDGKRLINAYIEYEATSGNTRVKITGATHFDFGRIVKPLMINGKWTTYAKDIMSEASMTEWEPIIKTSIKKAHKNCGSNSNNCKLAGWVGGDSTSSTTGSDISNELGANGGSGDDVNSDRLHINNFSTVTKDTIKALMPEGGSLNYPTDALYKRNNATGFNQDHVRITQYSYRPPRADLVKAGQPQAIKNFTLGVTRTSPLKEFLGMVKLPMPTDINDSNNVSWGEDTMNNLSAAVTSMIGADPMGNAIAAAAGKGIFGSGGGGIMIKNMQSLLENVPEIKGSASASALASSAVQSRLLAQLGFQVSPEDILARGRGVIPNANLELLFNAPTLREFQFAWKMTPRDALEAKRIRNIIRFFKQGMAARKITGKAGAASMFLGTPNVFNLQYKTNHELDIAGVNRLKTCAVTGCAINYTPDGIWSAYEDGQPVSTVMSLRMQELEPLYDTDYQTPDDEQQFSDRPAELMGSSKGNQLHPIDINEVGY
tara:strand:- start:967 stop:2472 length:1506 start_codon:yes stop_codon:yes gene_type:complete